MALTTTRLDASGIVHSFQVRQVDDASSPAAMSFTLGFEPDYVCFENATTRVKFEWYRGMTSGHAIKTVAAGTRTLETSGGVTVSDTVIGGPAPAQNDVVFVTARAL